MGGGFFSPGWDQAASSRALCFQDRLVSRSEAGHQPGCSQIHLSPSLARICVTRNWSLSRLPGGLHHGRPGPRLEVGSRRHQVPPPLCLPWAGPLMVVVAGSPLCSTAVTQPLYPHPSSHQVALTPKLQNPTSSICPSHPRSGGSSSPSPTSHLQFVYFPSHAPPPILIPL